MSAVEATAVTLRDEQAQLEATFLPGAGMLCSSLRHRGEELLAQNRGVEAYVERGKTMGIPLLYPWANRLAAFDYTVAGHSVAVPHDTTARGARRPRSADPRGDRRADGVGADDGARAWPTGADWGAGWRRVAGANRRAGRPRCPVARRAAQLERVARRAVRGVPVPPRPPLRGAPGGRTPGDRGDGARVWAGHGAGGVRLSPLPLPAGHTPRALAGGAAGDAHPRARRPPDPGRARRGAAQPGVRARRARVRRRLRRGARARPLRRRGRAIGGWSSSCSRATPARRSTLRALASSSASSR